MISIYFNRFRNLNIPIQAPSYFFKTKINYFCSFYIVGLSFESADAIFRPRPSSSGTAVDLRSKVWSLPAPHIMCYGKLTAAFRPPAHWSNLAPKWKCAKWNIRKPTRAHASSVLIFAFRNFVKIEQIAHTSRRPPFLHTPRNTINMFLAGNDGWRPNFFPLCCRRCTKKLNGA